MGFKQGLKSFDENIVFCFCSLSLKGYVMVEWKTYELYMDACLLSFLLCHFCLTSLLGVLIWAGNHWNGRMLNHTKCVLQAVRAQVISEIRSLSVENKQFRTIMDEKRKEMEPLQQALGKLRGAPNGGRERGSVICSSEEELNDLIKSLQYRIQHESIPLSEEKQILREIKQLEGTRDKVIANSAERARIQDALGEKEVIQDQVKLIGVDLDGVWKEKQVVNAKLNQLDEEKASIDKEINVLQDELIAITEKRDKTFETIQEMRKQREHAVCFFFIFNNDDPV
ncbi:proton pump-interactor 1-like [Olea europaea var. sylvestris]|uniref:proton pump-interactor 1-like n=1 Tax=Olea europaea var. sylvestris TaxID=158386 RepID=UPI000C1D17FF|nr:proton pump-interactor 1-like [Olea europaea var. sylvestris]